MWKLKDTLFQKLPDKKVECKDWQLRVLNFDPSNMPNQFNTRPYYRFQNVSIVHIFPKVNGVCACGCNQPLTGKRRRWATNECEYFAVAVRFILYGNAETISKYMRIYYGWKCFGCGCEDKGHDMGKNGIVAWIKIDHIIPVKLGGGACWLSNYQLLCHDCHTGKTNKDFGWNKAAPVIILPSLFNKGTQVQVSDTTKAE